jgi:hypothetical protein
MQFADGESSAMRGMIESVSGQCVTDGPFQPSGGGLKMGLENTNRLALAALMGLPSALPSD